MVVLAVGAIIVMPFLAGPDPSGPRTLLVLTACLALLTVTLALLKYGGRRGASVDHRRTTEWPAPDEFSGYRQRAGH